MSTIEPFFQQAQSHIDVFNAWATQVQPQAQADHICYKCGDANEFEALRRMFESGSQYYYQSMISHRRIGIVKFQTPIQTHLGEIWFLELSDQKPDHSQTSGFHHIEIYPTQQGVTELVADLEQKGITLEKITRPHHTTYDFTLENGFTVRLEDEPLIEKIQREEM